MSRGLKTRDNYLKGKEERNCEEPLVLAKI